MRVASAAGAGDDVLAVQSYTPPDIKFEMYSFWGSGVCMRVRGKAAMMYDYTPCDSQPPPLPINSWEFTQKHATRHSHAMISKGQP